MVVETIRGCLVLQIEVKQIRTERGVVQTPRSNASLSREIEFDKPLVTAHARRAHLVADCPQQNKKRKKAMHIITNTRARVANP